MNELIIREEFNKYPDIIRYNENNISVHSPYAETDIFFAQTRESLQDIDTFRSFLKNAESRFRASKEYKAYKSYLMSMGINRCQEFGNITEEDADIELHHNVLGLFDICLLITYHQINTIGCITTFDLIQLLIQEHYNNKVGCTFLSKTAHQIYTADSDGYIPPNMTFGRWWELLSDYKYGITFEIASKVIKYIKKYQDQFPLSINLPQRDEILSFAHFNEYGTPYEQVGYLPMDKELGYENNNYYDGGMFNGY